MRCYNGCPDTAYQKYLDARENDRKEIIKLGFTVTYFPSGEFYQGFKNYIPVTREHASIGGVLAELIAAA